MTYRFVQGIDYGPRKGTLGVALHMAEGGDGTLAYLARRRGETDAEWRTRVRGVSANFVILTSGEVVQMVAWSRASGSMNPRDRSDSVGFYRSEYIIEVLGANYVDPNAYSLSVEICGYRAQGPNAAQVRATIALVADMRRHYPSLRGAYGHADQTDTKGCPGTAAGMLEVWRTIGHGRFLEVDAMPNPYAIPGPPVLARIRKDQPLREHPAQDARVVAKVTDPTHWYSLAGQDEPGDSPEYYLVDADGVARMTWVNRLGITERVSAIGPETVDAEVIVGQSAYRGKLTRT